MRGRSSTRGSESTLRQLLDAETEAGRLHLAGIAMSYATGMTELCGRRVAERALNLRQLGEMDGAILGRLNPPASNG